MPRFRKRPVVVEAVQFTQANRNAWLALLNTHHLVRAADGLHAVIPRLEGDMRIHEGDWIIRGIAGELYPCRDDTFRQTYEEVL